MKKEEKYLFIYSIIHVILLSICVILSDNTFYDIQNIIIYLFHIVLFLAVSAIGHILLYVVFFGILESLFDIVEEDTDDYTISSEEILKFSIFLNVGLFLIFLAHFNNLTKTTNFESLKAINIKYVEAPNITMVGFTCTKHNERFEIELNGKIEKSQIDSIKYDIVEDYDGDFIGIKHYTQSIIKGN